jgi:hypothetical protein
MSLLFNLQVSVSDIDHCGTFGVKAIDARRRASQTEKRWID